MRASVRIVTHINMTVPKAGTGQVLHTHPLEELQDATQSETLGGEPHGIGCEPLPAPQHESGQRGWQLALLFLHGVLPNRCRCRMRGRLPQEGQGILWCGRVVLREVPTRDEIDPLCGVEAPSGSGRRVTGCKDRVIEGSAWREGVAQPEPVEKKVPVNRWDRTVDVATIVAALCAVVICVVVGWRVLGDSPQIVANADRLIPEWRTYSKHGNWMGRRDAAVVIVEFGDYECSACRAVAPHISAVRFAFPEDVAVVYRHWPPSYHRLAYPAARAAECAALQGQFEPFHGWLYRDSEWMEDPRERFIAAASRIGMANLEVFASCLDDPDPMETIERDVAAVEELGGAGTPTILVNGVLLGSLPDSLELIERVADALRNESGF